ncbi:peptidase A26 [Fibrobacter sp.]|uniref:peptidase A26 n=1 Tax=Fibrobacter sp. TaxID=35828 RepID=UPI0038699A9E
MLKKWCFAVALYAFVQGAFAAWSGSAKLPKVVKSDGLDYYEITTPEELVWFLDSATVLRKYDETLRAYLKNDIIFGSDTSKLCSKKWVRNKDQSLFQGFFDGRGHTVYGLNAENSMFETIGINVGEVRNINVANSSFGSDTAYYVGAIADMLRGVVQNVNVTNTKVVSAYYAGGIAGRMISSDDELTAIFNSSVEGGSVTGASYVGGIVGYSRGRILGCSNSAKVIYSEKVTDRTDFSYDIYIGGIVGYAESQPGYAIEGCVNRGAVEVVTAHREVYVGGVAGYVLGSVANLQNYGDVSSKVSFESDPTSSLPVYSYVGGVIGNKHLHRYETGELRDFLNEGNVTAMVEGAFKTGEFAVGGIFGENRYLPISNALNKGAVKAYGYGGELKTYVGGVIGNEQMNSNYLGFDKLGNRGNVYAEGVFRTYVGGVLGWADRPYNLNYALRLAYNYGNVTGSVADTSTLSVVLNVGGIVGYANEMMITDVYNRGSVSAKGKLAYGGSYAGGIVGSYTYADFYIQNAYSAAPSIKGDSIGGITGFINAMVSPRNTYYDGTLSNVRALGQVMYNDLVECTNCKKTTAELQSDEMVAALNTSNGETADRKLWVRRGGYPVFTFDSLYKNDSVFFDKGEFAMPLSHVEGDTLVYTISNSSELNNFLEMGYTYKRYPYKLKVELANDIVMGKDTVHLAKQKIATDTSRTGCLKMRFNGNGHTIYGLNMSRSMFYCVGDTALVENLTIANSRFENNYGMSAAGVAIELDKNSCIRNVKIRNSLVRGGELAGGIVAHNYGVVRNDTNENTVVLSDGVAGGIVAEGNAVVVENANSGRVSGQLVGGIIGYAGSGYSGSATIIDNSNNGMVLASGDGSVSAGGIVGHAVRSSMSRNHNTGLVEGRSTSGILTIGGIAGQLDSVNTFTAGGNWGRVHALSGKAVYAGGVIGLSNGSFSSLSSGTRFATTTVVYSYNYGPVTVKASDSVAYAGGLLGYGLATSVYDDYNRGTVKNEGGSTLRYTGGIASVIDGGRIASGYNYSDTLSGTGIASLVYEFLGGSNSLANYYYGGKSVSAFAKYAADETNEFDTETTVFKSFDEMKGNLAFLTNAEWKFGDCLPKMKADTTSACVVKVVKDSFGDSDVPYVLSFLEDVVLAGDDSTGQGEGGTTPVVVVKPVAPSMQVEVAARNVSVTGLAENRPVMLLDMRGHLIATARAHGSAVNLTVPRAGRYIVRSGKQTRIVNIR